MANLSNKKRHQQFGYKLVLIIILAVGIFSWWYLQNKQTGYLESKTKQEINVAQIPADDLKDISEDYLKMAKKIVNEGHENILVSADYSLYADGLGKEGSLKADQAKALWNNFEKDYGKIENVNYQVLGNGVKIAFEAVKDGQRQSFRRVLVFNNYEPENRKIQPALVEELIEKYPRTPESKKLIMGETASLGKFKGVKNSQITEIDPTGSAKWKLLFFYPADFTYVCPTECLGLLENFKKFTDLNVEIYAISTDLPAVHQAWNKMYFGELPYTLLSDYQKKLVGSFGFWNDKETVSFRGTVILDDKNVVRFMSVQENETGRNIEEYLRLIKAMQTPGLKPVDWHEGDKTL